MTNSEADCQLAEGFGGRYPTKLVMELPSKHKIVTVLGNWKV